MTGLEDAIQGLRQALDAPRRHPRWRWSVRRHMATVRVALGPTRALDAEAWLASREGALGRERESLLRRLTDLGPVVLEARQLEHVRRELLRLVVDLEHYRQRVNDLVYDGVSLELGGSE